MTLRPRWTIAALAAAAAVLTLALSVLPFVRFAYRAPELHVAIETSAGVIGGLAAYLFVARFLRDGRRGDLLVAWALAVFALTNLFLAALPAALSEGSGPHPATWAAISARLLGAAAFAVAAFDRARVLRRTRSLAAAGALALGALALASLVPVVGGAWLPVAVEPGLSPELSGRPLLLGDPAVLALQLVAVALFATAATGFARQADRTSDELLRWLALAAALGAFARVNYFLFPSLYSEWLYTGDFFRLAFFLVLLVGAAREIGQYWRSAAETAVLEERRRLARDLHDGLAQELAFIVGQASRLRSSVAAGERQAIETAAERALGEARRAIAALTRPLDEPLSVVLTDVAEEVAERTGLRLELSIPFEPPLDHAERECLLRILREAITNAARHARASTVRVEVANGDRVRVRVADDGIGFDPAALPAATASGGFGLTSMRERAVALGGELRIDSRPGGGTSVEVIFP